MSHRYRDAVLVVRPEGGPPASFRWHRRQYQVRAVLAHWVEATPWWPGSNASGSSGSNASGSSGSNASGSRSQVVQTWRVEAVSRAGVAGVYDLVHIADGWRLLRVID